MTGDIEDSKIQLQEISQQGTGCSPQATFRDMCEQFMDSFVEEQSTKCPNRIALIHENGSDILRYCELDSLGRELALLIQNEIVSALDTDEFPANPMISLMCERNISMVVSIIGILKAGCAYVPVDPSFPPDRQSHILTHSRSMALILDIPSYNRALDLKVLLPNVVIVLDPRTAKPIRRNVNSPPRIFLTHPRMESDIAYVLYTSGSTGKPKGVMVTHEGVINLIQWFSSELKITEKSVVLGLTTFCFDISVLEMFVPLFCGATLVIAESSTQKDPFRILDIIRERGVTLMQATPTTFEMMLATGWTGDTSIDFLVNFAVVYSISFMPITES